MTTIDEALRALLDARNVAEGELAAAQSRVDRLNIAIGALGGELVPAPVVPIDVDDAFANPVVVAEPVAAPKPCRTPAKPSANATDWPAVIAWCNDAKADGTFSTEALVATFGSKAKNWRAKARELGIEVTTEDRPTAPPQTTVICPDCGRAVSSSGLGPHRAGHRRRGEYGHAPEGPATTEPITRAPFDPQKARDAAAEVAAPNAGKVPWVPSSSPAVAPVVVERPVFTVEAATAALEGAA